MEDVMTQKKQGRYQVLNRDVIKYIAIAVMLLNHIAQIFLEPGTLLYEVFVDAGYFTAITMCYFLVEGYQYTRSKVKYGVRLFVFAVISQIPFQMAFQFGGALSMIYTLFICFLILVVRERVTNKALCILLQVLLVLVTICGDWPLMAAIFTIMFDAWRGDRKGIRNAYIIAAVIFGLLCLPNNLYLFPAPKAMLCTAGAILGIVISGIVIQFFYNGKCAVHGRNISKWFFYIFYPAHLIVLAWIDRFVL